MVNPPQVGAWNGHSIPTFYNGVTFRSRLEARWAVFLDQLDVRWFYEYEGFELASGRYVPDFWLPDIGMWLEVKPLGFDPWGADSNSYDARRCREFRSPLVIVCGSPAEQDDDVHERWYSNSSGYFNGGDYHYLFCTCPTCGKVGIEFDGRGARVCDASGCGGGDGDKSYSFDDPRILEAKSIAMAWRFV